MRAGAGAERDDGASMTGGAGIEAQQLFAALVLLIMALFVGSGYRQAGRWRRPLRIAAIVLFCLAALFAALQTAEWLSSTQP